MRFADKVCLVTGAGSGIGRATSIRFAQAGAKVAVSDHDEDGKETVAEIDKAGGTAMFVLCDVGDAKDVQAAIRAVVGKWQRIDVIVNNAAIMTFDPILDLTCEDWDRVQRVNMKSVFMFCKYGVPHMPPGGAIVNISSVHAHETTKKVVPYATSKGAMEAFTRGFSEEVCERNIRVNCVAPGAINTKMLWENPLVKSGEEKVEAAVGEPEDIAAAICFIASDEARFVNGTTLIVDGGRMDIL
jgi:glucose 1-dehydrogenase